MAQKLHDTYGYGYDNLKVLLGGWNTWKQENAKDAAKYPIETTGGAASTPASDTGNGGAATQPGVIVVTPATAPKP